MFLSAAVSVLIRQALYLTQNLAYSCNILRLLKNILFFHSVCCFVTVSKYYTSGTSLPSRFVGLFYELSCSEVRVSVACEMNRLFLSVYTLVRLIYVFSVKRDMKISFTYSSWSTSQTSQPIRPQI